MVDKNAFLFSVIYFSFWVTFRVITELMHAQGLIGLDFFYAANLSSTCSASGILGFSALVDDDTMGCESSDIVA